jgi:hypothetical protein
MRSVPVNLEWIEGARASGPPAGDRYACTASIDRYDTQWSVVLDLRLGTFAFLVPEAPHDQLTPGRCVGLWEGSRRVGYATVRDVERTSSPAMVSCAPFSQRCGLPAVAHGRSGCWGGPELEGRCACCFDRWKRATPHDMSHFEEARAELVAGRGCDGMVPR